MELLPYILNQFICEWINSILFDLNNSLWKKREEREQNEKKIESLYWAKHFISIITFKLINTLQIPVFFSASNYNAIGSIE